MSPKSVALRTICPPQFVAIVCREVKSVFPLVCGNSPQIRKIYCVPHTHTQHTLQMWYMNLGRSYQIVSPFVAVIVTVCVCVCVAAHLLQIQCGTRMRTVTNDGIGTQQPLCAISRPQRAPTYTHTRAASTWYGHVTSAANRVQASPP